MPVGGWWIRARNGKNRVNDHAVLQKHSKTKPTITRFCTKMSKQPPKITFWTELDGVGRSGPRVVQSTGRAWDARGLSAAQGGDAGGARVGRSWPHLAALGRNCAVHGPSLWARRRGVKIVTRMCFCVKLVFLSGCLG